MDILHHQIAIDLLSKCHGIYVLGWDCLFM